LIEHPADVSGRRLAPSVVPGSDKPGSHATRGGDHGGRNDGRQPEGSQEDYDTVSEKLGLERPAGGILHVAGPSPNGGWRVIEVWETEEDAKRFVREHLLSAVRAVGAPTAASAGVLARAQPHGLAGEEHGRETQGSGVG
jgi:hypothetical protein